MELVSDIRSFIVENFLYGQDDGFENNASFLDKGLIDSTGVLELVSFIEDKYKIIVNDEEITPENFDTINNLRNYIINKMNGSLAKVI